MVLLGIASERAFGFFVTFFFFLGFLQPSFLMPILFLCDTTLFFLPVVSS